MKYHNAIDGPKNFIQTKLDLPVTWFHSQAWQIAFHQERANGILENRNVLLILLELDPVVIILLIFCL
uniref:Uncharacterized protein n=1 Tax=Arundo donax TaxID=35708 RepID=A0A0A9FFP7_ARUDO